MSPREAAREALEQLRGERSEQARVEQAARRPLLDWARHVPEPKRPLNFDDFPFQLELYGPEATHDRELDVQKCTQGGFSAWSLRWCLFHADRGRTGMYVFPEDTHLKDFSNMRIRPVIRASQMLRERMQDDAVDNVGLKQIGLGWIAFRGSRGSRKIAGSEQQVATSLMSVDADVLVLDEYDSLEHANIGEAEQRVTGPLSAGLIRRLGVPSLPGWGISQRYDTSDQRTWTVKCDECRTWNPLHGSEGWLNNVDQERLLVVCRKCREPIDVRLGEWVAAYPDRDRRGYHLPKYAIHGVNIAGMVERSLRMRPLDVEKFHRNDLGEPYTPAESRLSREAILACVRQELRPQEGLTTPRLVTMGVDAKGRGTMHVTISEHVDEYRKRKVWVGTVDSFTDLVPLMDRYGVNMVGVDYMPEWQQAAAFVARFPGRAFRVGFLTGKQARQAAKLDVPIHVDDEEKLALVRRTQIIDTMLTNFRQQWVLLPPLESLPNEYPTHLQALVRTTEEKETGEKSVFYRSIGQDDFALAECYDVVATDLWYRQRGIAAVNLEQTQPHAARDAIDFSASRLTEPDADDYRPGPGGGDDYRPGMGDRDEFDGPIG